MRKNDKKQTEPTFLKIIYFDELAAQDYLDITNGGRLDWSKEDNRKRAAEILTEIEAQAQGGFNILNFITRYENKKDDTIQTINLYRIVFLPIIILSSSLPMM